MQSAKILATMIYACLLYACMHDKWTKDGSLYSAFWLADDMST
jgi:hypothetical protein